MEIIQIQSIEDDIQIKPLRKILLENKLATMVDLEDEEYKDMDVCMLLETNTDSTMLSQFNTNMMFRFIEFDAREVNFNDHNRNVDKLMKDVRKRKKFTRITTGATNQGFLI